MLKSIDISVSFIGALVLTAESRYEKLMTFCGTSVLFISSEWQNIGNSVNTAARVDSSVVTLLTYQYYGPHIQLPCEV